MAGLSVFLLLAAGALVLMTPSGRLQRGTDAPADQARYQGVQDGPLILDLLAAVLSAGASVENALLVVGDACDPSIGAVLTRVRAARLLGASWEAAWDAGATDDRPSAASPTGVPVADPRAADHSVHGRWPTPPFGRRWSSPSGRGPTPARSAPRRSAPQRPARRQVDPLPIIEDVRQGLRFGTATGAPSAALLHAHAAQLRRRHNREVDRRAAALGVKLVLPLGLCSLPAFICLGVVPVVLGLLPHL